MQLKINDGEIAPCCEHASMFTTRVSWIVKQYCDMSHRHWSDVPQAMKEELIDRIRVSHWLVLGSNVESGLCLIIVAQITGWHIIVE